MRALCGRELDMKKALYEKIVSLLDLDSTKSYNILDVGCGWGDFLGSPPDTIDSKSKLVGIDEMEHSINEAIESYPGIEFRHKKFIDSLCFDDNYFDIVVSIDTLECIPNKTALLDKVFRILKPDGKVLFSHWDWDTQAYNSAHKACIRKFIAKFSDWQQDWMETCDGQMGRRLWGLFESGGKYTGTIDCFTLLETEYLKGRYGFDRLQDLAGLVETGSIEIAEYEMICREMQNLADRRQYFYSVNSYIYAGQPHNNRMQQSCAADASVMRQSR